MLQLFERGRQIQFKMKSFANKKINRNKDMKIGINSRLLQEGKGGIPLYIKNLYTELLRIDKKNNYIFFQTGENTKIGSTKILKTIKGTVGAFLFDNFLVNNLIKKEKVNVFHGPSCVLPLLRLKDVKYIVTVHDLAFLKTPQIYGLLYKTYYSLALKLSLKNADIVITDSKSAKNDIIEFFKIQESKIKVIHLGVDNAFWDADHKERIIKEKYFFSLTTHPKRKNIVSVLEVMSKHKEFKKYKYVIAGLIGDDQLTELRSLIKNLGLIDNVVLWGYVSKDQLINFYQNAEFFIFPSFYEGFRFPVLEAMACKCPVVTSNNSSLTEITPNKDWLVDPCNLKDIYNKMSKMIKLKKEDRDELINSNYKFSKQFSWSKTAEEYIKLFEYLK